MKAIETKYKGYRFRSRLEARWAVFFDALGLKWEYEPEGFDLGFGELYLPDFKVRYPCPRDGAYHQWFEVKGDLQTVTASDWRKMLRFHEQVSGGLIILDGVPDCRMYLDPLWCLLGDDEDEYYNCSPGRKPFTGPFALHPLALEHERYGDALWCSHERPLHGEEHSNFWNFDDDVYDSNRPLEKLKLAVAAARSARFEFGERGAPV